MKAADIQHITYIHTQDIICKEVVSEANSEIKFTLVSTQLHTTTKFGKVLLLVSSVAPLSLPSLN